MDRVARILDWLRARTVPPVTLLVVPGRSWSEKDLQRLRELAEQGYEFAAHGWHHETTPRKLYHRIHAAMISKNVAEHLDLDSAGVLQLMIRSREWFRTNQLPVPHFYVPPAWALGPIAKADLLKAPFERIETTRGIIHLSRGSHRFEKLPLTGYEADTPFREFFLRQWNAAQFRRAQAKGQQLRISIHPNDLELSLADQLDDQIRATRFP
jgi:predicted deacetylase